MELKRDEMATYRFFIAGLILTLTLITAASGAAGVSVRNAWVREMPPGVTMMAGYMALRNNTSLPQILVAASSPGFETVTIHRSIVQDGMARMARIPQIEIAANARLVFAPGGYHLMLMNPKQTVRVGDRIDITLEFRGGLRLPVTFEVRREEPASAGMSSITTTSGTTGVNRKKANARVSTPRA
jgi:periplasmic copper chaperone A